MQDLKKVLEASVNEGIIEKVRKLLDQIAYQKCESLDFDQLIDIAINKNHMDIVKYLLQNGALKEDKEFQVCQKVFLFIQQDDSLTGSERSDILEILLDHGLLVDHIIDENSTPLQLSVRHGEIEMISLLLRRGADIKKKKQSSVDQSILYIATVRTGDRNYESTVKLLLKHGAPVNDRISWGHTPLHIASVEGEHEIVCELLEHGADVNLIEMFGNTPFMLAFNESRVNLVKKFAIMRLEGQPICEENLESLKEDDECQKLFVDCVDELQKMKKHRLCDNISLYDVFRMKKKHKKLFVLTKNKNFCSSFESSWERESFMNYGKELDYIFEDALARRNNFLSEEKRLLSIFKDYLPELAIRKIAYFTYENIFFSD